MEDVPSYGQAARRLAMFALSRIDPDDREDHIQQMMEYTDDWLHIGPVIEKLCRDTCDEINVELLANPNKPIDYSEDDLKEVLSGILKEYRSRGIPANMLFEFMVFVVCLLHDLRSFPATWPTPPVDAASSDN